MQKMHTLATAFALSAANFSAAAQPLDLRPLANCELAITVADKIKLMAITAAEIGPLEDRLKATAQHMLAFVPVTAGCKNGKEFPIMLRIKDPQTRAMEIYPIGTYAADGNQRPIITLSVSKAIQSLNLGL